MSIRVCFNVTIMLLLLFHLDYKRKLSVKVSIHLNYKKQKTQPIWNKKFWKFFTTQSYLHKHHSFPKFFLSFSTLFCFAMYFKAFLQAWKLVLEKLEEEDANGKERQVQSRRAAEDTLMRFLAKQRWKNFFITFLLCLNLVQKSKTKNQSFTHYAFWQLFCDIQKIHEMELDGVRKI